MAAHYEKVRTFEDKLLASENKNKDLHTKMDALQAEQDGLRTRLNRYEDPKILKIATGIAAAIIFVIFLFGFFLGRRTMRGRI